MRKIVSTTVLGLSLFAVMAAPALAYTPEELRAFALDAQRLAREVLSKCSSDQQKVMGAELSKCMDMDAACKDYASDTCAKEGGEDDARMPCDIECTTVRAIACIDVINAHLPACGITEQLNKPEDVIAPPAEPGEPVFAPTSQQDGVAKIDDDVRPANTEAKVLPWAAGGAFIALVGAALLLRKKKRS